MKKHLSLMAVLVVVSCLAVSVGAQTLPDYHIASGDWTLGSDGRVYQSDINSGLARLDVYVPQSGPMVYRFNVAYEGGLEDGHGGFGVHLFADDSSVYHGRSWGFGDSYLFWLNYDAKPVGSDIPAGWSAEVYRSVNASTMNLVEAVDLNYLLADLPLSAISNTTIPVTLRMNGNTGEFRVYDPTDASGATYFYYVVDDAHIPSTGEWIGIRTNGMSMSVGY